MKALKMFVLLILTAGGSYGQTKEETILWLKEKLEKHGCLSPNGMVEIYSVSPCEIYYKTKNSKVVPSTYKFNPGAAVWEVKDNRIYAKSGNIIEQTIFFNGYDGGVEPGTRYEDSFVLWENGFPDIYERFAKALNHLASFCEKKKETF